jgi:hypothetical protein
MFLTQGEQMAEYQDSILSKSNIHVSTNTVTRSGKVTKGPLGATPLGSRKGP